MMGLWLAIGIVLFFLFLIGPLLIETIFEAIEAWCDLFSGRGL
jgi:hypothetical protein